MRNFNPEYWETQIELVKTLALLGIPYKASDRLRPFRLRLKLLSDRQRDEEMRNEAIRLIDHLVELRRQGGEPEHTKEKYI